VVPDAGPFFYGVSLQFAVTSPFEVQVASAGQRWDSDRRSEAVDPGNEEAKRAKPHSSSIPTAAVKPMVSASAYLRQHHNSSSAGLHVPKIDHVKGFLLRCRPWLPLPANGVKTCFEDYVLRGS